MITTEYTHKTKKGTYIVLFPCQYQHESVWFEAVCYKSLESGEIYVRKEDDFNLKFAVKE